jgi:hypothetical protein
MTDGQGKRANGREKKEKKKKKKKTNQSAAPFRFERTLRSDGGR